MSTEKFDHYQKLYKEYVSHMVDMHNNHALFSRTLGYNPGIHFRNSVRALMKLEKALLHASQAAFKEAKATKRNEKILQREEKKNKASKRKPKISADGDV